jgi:GTPase SAR1 family protein
MDWPQKLDHTQPLSNIKWALKILFVGDEGVGKTSLMCGVSDGVYVDGFRTKLGSSFGAKQFKLDPVRVQLQIWNLTDSPNLANLRHRLIRGGAGVVYVFSLTDRTSFAHVNDWVEEVQRILGIVPSILVGMRQDTRNRRRVTKREAKQLAKHLRLPYLEVAQEKDKEFEKALQNLVVDILKDA